MMYLTLISLVVLPNFVILYEEKPNRYSNFDYCTLNCNGIVHSACKCQKTPPREELDFLPYMEFRTKVLHEHNKWRNFIASGAEKRSLDEDTTPPAADMVVMSYDLEMEYVVRCRALTSYRHNDKETGHDKCKKRIGDKNVGQNLFGISVNISDLIQYGIKAWYNEVRLIPKDIIEKYKGGRWDHFTQLIWWNADRVGCAWIYNPDNTRSWLYTLLCNYASTIKQYQPGNIVSKNVYTKSDTPCSACPNKTKCGETPDYPYLCGKQEPIPTDAPAFIPGRDTPALTPEPDTPAPALIPRPDTPAPALISRGASVKAAIQVNKFVVCFIIMIVYLAY